MTRQPDVSLPLNRGSKPDGHNVERGAGQAGESFAFKTTSEPDDRSAFMGPAAEASPRYAPPWRAATSPKTRTPAATDSHNHGGRRAVRSAGASSAGRS